MGRHYNEKIFDNFDREEIFVKDNFKVVRMYRQALDKNLPYWDPSAMGTPSSDVWNEYILHDRYGGNWRDYQLNCYGHCFYFILEDKIVLQWDLFYPRGAHIHYNGMGPSKGIVCNPLDWAYEILSDEELFIKHLTSNMNMDEAQKINLTSEDLKSLRDCVDGLYRGIITE